MAEILSPVIPTNITVHLGPPDSAAENVTVPFAEYVKNVASNEIYPTWPEEALKANIYVITSYVLNRIYTEYYRSRGYDFDITSSTSVDQSFRPGNEIFENISMLTDNQFNSYVVKGDSAEPYFTAFCNGTTTTCAGLSQWGSVSLANEGLTAAEILKRYYGDDINIVENVPVGENLESYPGFPLSLGSSGNAVKLIQIWLNRIGRNYPAIPNIESTDGIFGVDTENAVRKFQQIFSLPETGVVDNAAWYKIRRYYNAVKSLSDLFSEGVKLDEIEVPYPRTAITEGDTGIAVLTVQYYLQVLSYFNGNLKPLRRTGVYDTATTEAVKTFQKVYGINQTGNVGVQTWVKINEIYRDILASLPENYNAPYAKYYPGYVLSYGQTSTDVEDLQQYITAVSGKYNEVSPLPITGYYGDQTRAAVEQLQKIYGIEVSGVVGPVTWGAIADDYNKSF